MVMEYISGGELFDYILNHGKVQINFFTILSMIAQPFSKEGYFHTSVIVGESLFMYQYTGFMVLFRFLKNSLDLSFVFKSA